jgi:guanylate kinase
VEAGEFLEWAEVHGNRYGTLASTVRERLERGTDVILEIDPQGAMQVKGLMPEAVLVFIIAPSIAELERRIRARGAETDEQIKTRLATAVRELQLVETYDHVVENDDVARATDRLVGIIESLRSDEGCS